MTRERGSPPLNTGVNTVTLELVATRISESFLYSDPPDANCYYCLLLISGHDRYIFYLK